VAVEGDVEEGLQGEELVGLFEAGNA